jgi:hypothetical protein
MPGALEPGDAVVCDADVAGDFGGGVIEGEITAIDCDDSESVIVRIGGRAWKVDRSALVAIP